MDKAGEGDAAEKPRGIFGRVFGGGGKRYKSAKMGNKLDMYYNEKLKCWVQPGEEEAKEKEVAELMAPPPPKSMSTASLQPASSQEDAGSAAANGGNKPPGLGTQPIYGGARGTSRYASASSFSISSAGNGAAAAPPSLMAGLKPPSSFGLPGGGTGASAPAVFKPMAPVAVEEEATSPAAEVVQENGVQQQQPQQEDAGQAATATADSQYDNNNQYYTDTTQPQQLPDNNNTTTASELPNSLNHQNQDPSPPSSAISDPVILEVLSFWSYYRNCGYDTEAMTEWVDQNYEPEYTGINYEELLLNPEIAAAVEQHISENKNTDAPGADSFVTGGGGSVDYNTNNNLEGAVGASEMVLEDALVAEAAGEYSMPPSDLDNGVYHQQEEQVASDTTLVAPPELGHLPGAESGWTGFDDGLEVEGGAHGGGGGDDEYAVAAPCDAANADAASGYEQYDQYGQYHTTDQYQVEGAAGEEGGNAFAAVPEVGFGGDVGINTDDALDITQQQQQQQEEDPTLGQVLGNIFQQQQQPVDGAGAGQFLSAVGGTLKGLLHDVANVGTTMDSQQEEHNDDMLPLGEDQWGYTTPAAGPSPARGSAPGGGPRFPLPGDITNQQQQQNQMGVHPIFSPGQLAAELGVPREAVSMSALFAAEAASVGTLSSRDSEDGWSDNGVADLGLHSGEVTSAVEGGPQMVVEQEQRGGGESAGAAAVEEEEMGSSMEVLPPPQQQQQQQKQGVVDRTTSSASQIDVVGPWEAAAAAIEASTATAPPTSAPPPPPPAPVEMESKSTQADTIAVVENNSVAVVDDAQYQAALLEIESLKEQLTAATTAAETATAEVERSNEEAAVHAATLAEVMGARDAAVNEKQALEEEIENLKTEVEQIPSLLEKCSALETAAAEHASSLSDFKSKLATVTEERDDLATKLAEAQAQDASAAASAGELAVLQVELDEAKEALEARENECEDLKAALELKDDAIFELRAQETRANESKKEEIAAIESRFESQLASLRGELSAAHEALAAAEESASDNVAAALEDVGERIQVAVAEAVEEKNSEFERQESAWKEEQTTLVSQISSLEALVFEKDSQLVELRGYVATKTAELEAANAAAEGNLAVAVAAATAEVAASKEAEVEAAQTRVKELEKKFALAKKKIAGQTSQQEQLTAEIQTLKQQLEGASTGHNDELSEMAQALSDAAAAQEAFTHEISALQSRLEHLQATKEEEIQVLVADNSQLVQVIGERDALVESLSSDIQNLHEQLTSLTASFEAERASLVNNQANDELLLQLQAELEAAKEDISQWAAVAEDADARCTAAEEALAAEEDARQEDAASAVRMQEELAVLQQTLASTEAQLNELALIQEQQQQHQGYEAAAGGAGASNANINEEYTEQLNAEVTALRQRLSELESELTIANQTLRSLDRGGFEDAVEEVGELRSRLAAASQVAAAKEEELLKYKKQLVKAKKLRNADLEKIAALEETISSNSGGGGEGASAPAPSAAVDTNNNSSTAAATEIAALREEVSSLQEQLTALRDAAAETDAGLNEALSALGTEELKVARLAEMLVEKGMEEKVVEQELNDVDEMCMMGDEEEGQEEEESLV